MLYLPVSGIANSDVSVATRNVPWIDIPTPPPITTPSHNDNNACSTRDEAKAKKREGGHASEDKMVQQGGDMGWSWGGAE